MINQAVNIELRTGNFSGIINFIDFTATWVNNSKKGSWLLAGLSAQMPPGMVNGFESDAIKKGIIKIGQAIIKNIDIKVEHNENPMQHIDYCLLC